MNIIFFVTFVAIESYAFSNIPSENYMNYKDKISECLIEISETCLYNKPTVFIYDDDFGIHKSVNPEENHIKQVLSTVDCFIESDIPVIISSDISHINESKDIYEGSLLVVALFENCKELSEIDIIFFLKPKYLIIIEDSESDYEMLLGIASELQSYDITYVLRDVKLDGEYIFLTTIPRIDEITCGLSKKTQLSRINSCINGSLEKKKIENVFPATVPNNLKLCPFNVGMATMFPYAMIPNKDTMKNFEPIAEGHGSDVEMVKIIANNVNATLMIYYIYRQEENPFLHQEYLSFLLNGSLDLCAGGLYRIYGDVVAYSGIYSIQSIIWIYTAERDIRSWQMLIQKISGLYFFLVVYVTYSIIWNLIKKIDKNSVPLIETFLYSWGALVGATPLQDARSMKQKILNIVYLIMCLHLSAYIGAQIYSYLTIQGPPHAYKTAGELQESGKKPYLQYTGKFFVDDKKHETFVNTSGDCNDFRHCEETILNNTGATLVLDSYFLEFQAETSINDEARVLRLPESALTVFHEIIMRKDFPLVFKIQNLVTRLFEGGICQKLYNDGIGLTVFDKAKIVNKNILSNSYSCTVGCEITFEQLGGTFYMWMFGCLFAFVVFILELLWKRRI